MLSVMFWRQDELGLTQYATLQPAANFNRLEEVLWWSTRGCDNLLVEEEETEHPEDGAERKDVRVAASLPCLICH